MSFLNFELFPNIIFCFLLLLLFLLLNMDRYWFGGFQYLFNFCQHYMWWRQVKVGIWFKQAWFKTILGWPILSHCSDKFLLFYLFSISIIMSDLHPVEHRSRLSNLCSTYSKKIENRSFISFYNINQKLRCNIWNTKFCSYKNILEKISRGKDWPLKILCS